MTHYIKALPLALLLSLPIFAMEKELITEQGVDIQQVETIRNLLYTRAQLTEMRTGSSDANFERYGDENSPYSEVNSSYKDLWKDHRLDRNKELDAKRTAYNQLSDEDKKGNEGTKLVTEIRKILDTSLPTEIKKADTTITFSSPEPAYTWKRNASGKWEPSGSCDDSALFLGANRTDSADPRVKDPKTYFANFAKKASAIHQKYAKMQVADNATAVQKIQQQKLKNDGEIKDLQSRKSKLDKYVGKNNAVSFRKKAIEKIDLLREKNALLDKETQALNKYTIELRSELPWAIW